jgi:hypothetical protein
MNKEMLIELIDIMLGLTHAEKETLKEMDERKVEFKYKMALTEKTDEMLN